jgi:hypothetical protein
MINNILHTAGGQDTGVPILDKQHNEILKRIDAVLEVLREHDKEEHAVAKLKHISNDEWNEHHKKHKMAYETLEYFRAIMVHHMNNDDKIFHIN